jgi:hypothetical protein
LALSALSAPADSDPHCQALEMMRFNGNTNGNTNGNSNGNTNGNTNQYRDGHPNNKERYDGNDGNEHDALSDRKFGQMAGNLFSSFSAACFYFGQSLTDELAKMDLERGEGGLVMDTETSAVIPIGLMSVAIGGSQIEGTY